MFGVQERNLWFIISLLITDGVCHKDTPLKGIEVFSPHVDVHPWASFYKMRFESQPHIWEVSISVHLLCVHQGKSPQTAAIKLRSHRRRVLLWYIQGLLTAGWGLWVEEHRPTGKHGKCNFLQDLINVRKAVHKAFPDLSQKTKVWSVYLSTRSNSLSYPQVPEMLPGKEHESWVRTISLLSSLYPSLCHCSSAKQPEGHGEIFHPHFIYTHAWHFTHDTWHLTLSHMTLYRDWILKKTERKI